MRFLSRRILSICLLAMLLCLPWKWFRKLYLILLIGFPARSIMSPRPPFPSQEALEKLSEADIDNMYYLHMQSIDIRCKQTQQHGNEYDGDYYVCNDLAVKPKQPCLVYSFGINYDYSFDVAVRSVYGCEVHSFDPSMAKNHKPPDGIFFHAIGLGDEDKVNSKGWTMKTLTSIKAQLNHTKVDILKIDIEDDEHIALPNIIAAGELRHVKQLLFELHIPGMENRTEALGFMLHGLQLLRDLHNNGFHVFHSQPNEFNYVTSPFTGLKRSTCYELSLVYLNRKKTR